MTAHSQELVTWLRSCYSRTGTRAFDAEFWGEQTYEKQIFLYAPTPAGHARRQ